MAMDLHHWIGAAIDHHAEWTDGFGHYAAAPELEVDESRLSAAFGELFARLEDNYPFFHPRYAGQMLKPPHPAAVTAYLAAMLVNPNNHALDGGPATAQMELEAMAELAEMIGFETHIGHLTTSGTIANLEALFVARSVHPDQGVAFSDQAHYTHGRMCHLLGMAGHAVGTDELGRIDLDEVEDLAQRGAIGTVVLTTGTTGLGAVDRVDEALELKERYGLRVHVDGAYGGFFAVLGNDVDSAASLGLDPGPWGAIAHCDSFVVDPHKHGLQPYGCGAVLFADAGAGRHYAHDSPYTYFTGGGAAHLGEISLECSRAGAAAAAWWLTLRLFPLTPGGLGRVLAATRRSALSFASLIGASEQLCLYQRPELDIVTYFARGARNLAAVDASSARILAETMAGDDPVFVSVLKVPAAELVRRHARLAPPAADPVVGPGLADDVRILRSVLMKPESEPYTRVLLTKLEAVAAST
jgi:glutamate/tyrosine decarboxylase-like PLP-dependent enzyme